MFGRYNCAWNCSALASTFKAQADIVELPQVSYAPGHEAPVVRRHPKTGVRHLSLLQWGFVLNENDLHQDRPHRADIEQLRDDKALKRAFEVGRRCLVPATEFYLWKKVPSGKQSYEINLRPFSWDEQLAFAGLWTAIPQPPLEPLRCFLIITTRPVEPIAEIGNRMPLVLPVADWPLWLGEQAGDLDELLKRPIDYAFHVHVLHRMFDRPGNTDFFLEVEDVPGDPVLSFRIKWREFENMRQRLENMLALPNLQFSEMKDNNPNPVDIFRMLVIDLIPEIDEIKKLLIRSANYRVPIRNSFLGVVSDDELAHMADIKNIYMKIVELNMRFNRYFRVFCKLRFGANDIYQSSSSSGYSRMNALEYITEYPYNYVLIARAINTTFGEVDQLVRLLRFIARILESLADPSGLPIPWPPWPNQLFEIP